MYILGLMKEGFEMAAAYEKYCAKKYLKIYKDEYSHILGTKTSANALKTAERKAQKTAIESAFKMALVV